MLYFVNTPGWLKKIYPGCTWHIDTKEKKIYLSFDDGPHPHITPFVLDTLEQYQAKATFFCIGKNVAANPGVYEKIVSAGHTVGNHTYDHLNGWKTNTETYLENITSTKQLIKSCLFRPPYGKISFAQLRALRLSNPGMKVIMWSVLSADFDRKISARRCTDNVINHARSGSVVVFHDSEKAFDKLKIALPLVLDHFSGKGYVFEKLEPKGNDLQGL